MTTPPTGAKQSLPALVDTYCRRIGPAVLEQQAGNSISSPLGIWLLLAACATAASGDDREQLEEVLGCSAPEAASFLERFLQNPPPALQSAVALWVRGADRTSALVEWSASLPRQIERGPIPSQAEADAWAERSTSGLIERFPLQITELTRLILASALATKVTWQRPLDVVPAEDHLRGSSPWAGQVQHVLLDRSPVFPPLLAETEAAGVVAVHVAVANEDLAVLSVAGDAALERQAVLDAAYEIARLLRQDELASASCSLFDLPLGQGHSWEIFEAPVPSEDAGARSERVESAALVSWFARSVLDLQRSDRFGVAGALAALLALIGPTPGGDGFDAVQSAVASYTPDGFDAAAITGFVVTLAARRVPQEKGLRRTARLFFDHPYAAVALAGHPSDFTGAPDGHTEMFGLPLFSAWVAEPGDLEPAPA